jgi:hypothetical protein
MAEVGSHSARRTAARKMSLVLKDEKPQSLGQQIARSSLSDARRSQQNEPAASFSALAPTLRRTAAPCSQAPRSLQFCGLILVPIPHAEGDRRE